MPQGDGPPPDPMILTPNDFELNLLVVLRQLERLGVDLVTVSLVSKDIISYQKSQRRQLNKPRSKRA